MTMFEKRRLLEAINICVRYNMFTDSEVEQIEHIYNDAIDRTLKETEKERKQNEHR